MKFSLSVLLQNHLPKTFFRWCATTAYLGGATVSLNGVNYKANWWTHGNSPDSSNGGNASGKPLTIVAGVMMGKLLQENIETQAYTHTTDKLDPLRPAGRHGHGPG